jgi:SH3-like domain-containing protein
MHLARPFTSNLIAAGMIACLWLWSPLAADAAEPLPLPRFVSLKSSEVNLRTGPGTRYPIEWVYQRRGLPVEIIAEFDNWRRVRDSEGVVGWVHRALLSGRRSALVAPPERIFRRAPEANATALLRAESGVLVEIISCNGAWCKVSLDDTRAWTKQVGLWGVYPGELID